MRAAAAAPEQARTVVKTEISNYDNWVVSCEIFKPPRSKHCVARTQIVSRELNRPVLIISVMPDAQNGRPRLVIQSPTNLRIEPGVQVSVAGGASQKAAFQTCEQSGCMAVAPDDPAFIAAFQAAKEASVTIVGLDGRGIKFDFPLNGAQSAIAAVAAAK